MRRFALVIAAVALSCSSNNPTGTGECTANDDCQSGQVCDNGECVVLCVADADCDAGEICTDSLCAPGQRANPTIDQVNGDGSVVCPDADGSNCVAAGLAVLGSNLEGASFELTAQAGANYPLTARPGFTDTYVELDLPANVGLGTHTLRAVNGAGSADQTFDFIQGPQGPQGPAGADGSPDTGAEILLKLAGVDGTGSGLDADTVDGAELADIQDSIDAAMALVPPIGTIMAWHKNLDGVPTTLPDGWMECNGQQVQDATSPLNYTYLPDLNSEAFAGTGRGKYIRGGPVSGVMNDSTGYGDNGAMYTGNGGGGYYNACYHAVVNSENNADGATYSTTTRRTDYFQVTAMTVVWIIRVK